MSATLVDISTNGMRVVSKGEFAVGQDVAVRFTIHRAIEPVTIKASVRWVRERFVGLSFIDHIPDLLVPLHLRHDLFLNVEVREALV